MTIWLLVEYLKYIVSKSEYFIKFIILISCVFTEEQKILIYTVKWAMGQKVGKWTVWSFAVI